jgi:hypothetical protein
MLIRAGSVAGEVPREVSGRAGHQPAELSPLAEPEFSALPQRLRPGRVEFGRVRLLDDPSLVHRLIHAMRPSAAAPGRPLDNANLSAIVEGPPNRLSEVNARGGRRSATA